MKTRHPDLTWKIVTQQYANWAMFILYHIWILSLIPGLLMRHGHRISRFLPEEFCHEAFVWIWASTNHTNWILFWEADQFFRKLAEERNEAPTAS